jgi:hypothetical protein
MGSLVMRSVRTRLDTTRRPTTFAAPSLPLYAGTARSVFNGQMRGEKGEEQWTGQDCSSVLACPYIETRAQATKHLAQGSRLGLVALGQKLVRVCQRCF